MSLPFFLFKQLADDDRNVLFFFFNVKGTKTKLKKKLMIFLVLRSDVENIYICVGV